MAEETKNQKNYLMPALVVLLIVAAFAIGTMWQKIQVLQDGGTNTAGVDKAKIAPGADSGTTNPTADDIRPVSDVDHIRGARDAQITLIEYSDYECPFCGRFHPDVVRLMAEYEGKINWVYRHFPLRQIHPSAETLARASECIAKENGNDAFWKFTDALFAKQGVSTDHIAIAKELGFSTANLDTCIASQEIIDKVQADYDDGLSAKVQGTPHTVLLKNDGTIELLQGAVPFDQLKAAVERMLK